MNTRIQALVVVALSLVAVGSAGCSTSTLSTARGSYLDSREDARERSARLDRPTGSR